MAAHLIPVRRCNLSCTYCNEFDDHSEPVPTGDLLRRIDRLAALGTGIITLSGGEPLLHPDLDDLIHVTVNSVIGSGIHSPEDALTITPRARPRLFYDVGILHDAGGGLLPLDERHQKILQEVVAVGKSVFDYANYNRFQRKSRPGPTERLALPRRRAVSLHL